MKSLSSNSLNHANAFPAFLIAFFIAFSGLTMSSTVLNPSVVYAAVPDKPETPVVEEPAVDSSDDESEDSVTEPPAETMPDEEPAQSDDDIPSDVSEDTETTPPATTPPTDDDLSTATPGATDTPEAPSPDTSPDSTSDSDAADAEAPLTPPAGSTTGGRGAGVTRPETVIPSQSVLENTVNPSPAAPPRATPVIPNPTNTPTPVQSENNATQSPATNFLTQITEPIQSSSGTVSTNNSDTSLPPTVRGTANTLPSFSGISYQSQALTPDETRRNYSVAAASMLIGAAFLVAGQLNSRKLSSKKYMNPGRTATLSSGNSSR